MNKNDPHADYLRGFVNASDQARAVRSSGLDGCSDPAVAAIIDRLVTESDYHCHVLAATSGRPTPDRQQRRADRRWTKLYDKARARPGYERVYGDASLSPAALAAKSKQVRPAGGDVAAAEHADSSADASASIPPVRRVPTADGAAPPRIYIDRIRRVSKPPATGSLEEAIGLVDAHITQASPALAAKPVATAQPTNPFVKPARQFRTSALTPMEVWRVFDANSFLMWRYGETMTVHVIFLWDTYRVRDHEAATRHLGARAQGRDRMPGEAPRPLRTVLRLWSSHGPLPVTCVKMSGVSKALGRQARNAAGFRSMLSYGDAADLFSGKELEEFERNKLLEELLPSLAI